MLDAHFIIIWGSKLEKTLADEIALHSPNSHISEWLSLNELVNLCRYCNELNLNVIGLMCIPPANEEVEKYFNLMLKIHNTQGMGVLKVLNILRKAYESNKRLLKLTKESEKFVERGEMYFRALNKFGIDERITGMVEIGEKTSNLWPNISKSIKYAKMLKEEKVNQIKKVFGALKTIATIAVIMAMIQLILIIVSVQQLVISSMT